MASSSAPARPAVDIERLNTPDVWAALARITRGIEREALRTDAQGNLSLTPHPRGLGSKLTHPLITTDFSEAQLELITPASERLEDTLGTAMQIHQSVYAQLGDELLWPASIPCLLPAEAGIPLAQYGPSNIGRLKTTYRSGLSQRYGRAMQTICAIHYNVSFPHEFFAALQTLEASAEAPEEFRSRRYFDMMRNFRRLSWLPLYLFGASPALAENFVQGRHHDLAQLTATTLFEPYATSLRNGDLGYQSGTQAGLIDISYDSLPDYVERLTRAICQQHPPYSRFGTDPASPVQINDSVLQSEAEFYTTIRAKRVAKSGQNALRALWEEGVEYVEVRLLDVNPYLPLGIDAAQIRFLDTLLIHCLLTPSPTLDDAASRAVASNMRQTAYRGRDPELRLTDGDILRSIREWGGATLAAMTDLIALLDHGHQPPVYGPAVAAQQVKLDDPTATPSAQLLADLQGGRDFIDLGLDLARRHRDHFRSAALDSSVRQHFDELAETSRVNQHTVDEAPSAPLPDYLANLQGGYSDLLKSMGGGSSER
jgi:glutamate--cysteine ligase